ncbi:Ig-like domain-containing protein [Bowmanella denitrificans]|uniref:Ig-like domain-containing protein n=1 Tax=Bowmanella denitrificans TaxID=366582 RepID=UPI000C9C55C5|nr:Ig-like domain-containing protein [Bowmanella denitrificans]
MKYKVKERRIARKIAFAALYALGLLSSAMSAAQTLNTLVVDTYQGNAAATDANNILNPVNAGINLAGDGGLVMVKSPVNDSGFYWLDTERGAGVSLNSTAAMAEQVQSSFAEFTERGFVLQGTSAHWNRLGSEYPYIALAKKPGVLDIITYTGDGAASREIPHQLNADVGMIIVKALDMNNGGAVWHRSLSSTNEFKSLNLFGFGDTNPAAAGAWWGNKQPSASALYVGNSVGTNTAGARYVAYVFADSPDDGIVVGHYVGNSTDGVLAQLPWQPDAFILKPLNTQLATNWTLWSPRFGDRRYGMLDLAWAGLPTSAGSSMLLNEAGELVKTSLASGHNITWNESGKQYLYVAIKNMPEALPPDPNTLAITPDVFTLTNKAATLLDVLHNDSGATQSGLYFKVPSLSAAGAALSIENNQVHYTPPQADIATDSFDYRIEDNQGNVLAKATAFIKLPVANPSNFAIVPYIGNGGVNNINAGLNLAQGGLVMIKHLNPNVSDQWYWFDTARGPGRFFTSDGINEGTSLSFSAFTSSGFELNGSAIDINKPGELYVALVFKEEAGFFDITTYPGNNINSTAISHRLDAEVGMLILKPINHPNSAWTWHSAGSMSGASYGIPGDIPGTIFGLMGIGGMEVRETNVDIFNFKKPATNRFWVGNSVYNNGQGVNYIAYAFAQNPAAGLFFGDYQGQGTSGTLANLPWRSDLLVRKAKHGVKHWGANLFALGADKEIGFSSNSPGWQNTHNNGEAQQWQTELTENGQVISHLQGSNAEINGWNGPNVTYFTMAFSEVKHADIAPVLPVNQYAMHDNYSVAGGELSGLSVMDNDLDSAGFHIISVHSSDNANVHAYLNQNLIGYTPADGFCGQDYFTYTLANGENAIETATVTVNVDCSGSNKRPVANNDEIYLLQGQDATVNVLANDTDPENAALRVMAINVPSNSTVKGSLHINADNSLSYIADKTDSSTDAYTDEFTYVVQDDLKQNSWAFVRIHVVPRQGPPSANDDQFTVASGDSSALDLLTNDVSPSGASWRISSVTPSANASLVIYLPEARLLRYAPNSAFCGRDTFSYTVDDGLGLQKTANVVVYVNCGAGNAKPTANDDYVEVNAKQDLLLDLLANDTDPEEQPLKILSVKVEEGQSAKGALRLNPDNSVTYLGAKDYRSANPYTDVFIYVIADSVNQTSWGKVNVLVLPVNEAPVAQHDRAEGQEDSPLVINVLANDSDPDGDALTLVDVSTPAHGQISIGPDKQITYQPKPNFFGEDHFTYRVSDGELLSAPATVTISVAPVNDAPVAMNDSYTTGQNLPVTLLVLQNDTDADNDALTLTLLSQPQLGTLLQQPDQRLLYTPNQDVCGADSFEYSVSDQVAESASATVSINIHCSGSTQLNWQSAGDDVTQIRVGQAITLQWHFPDAAECQSDFTDSTSNQGSESRVFYTPGQYQFNFSCAGMVYSTPLLEVSKLSSPQGLRRN